MATRAAPPAPRLTWATFALTEDRWLRHAMAWTVALWASALALPWLLWSFAATIGLGLMAAAASGYASPERPAPRAATLVRYLVVDVVFVAFAAPFLIVPLHIALHAVDLAPSLGMVPVLPIASFVAAFYSGLALVGHASGRGHARLPLAGAALVAALLAMQLYGPARDYHQREGERGETVARYEQSTGKAPSRLDRMSIGNSRHGFDNRVMQLEVDGRGRLLAVGGFTFYGGRPAHGFVRVASDGTLDATFAPLPAGDPYLLAPLRVRVLESGVTAIRKPSGAIVRLHEDGKPDTTYRANIPLTLLERQPAEAFDIAPDGSVLATLSSGFIGKPGDACFVRLDAAGERDAAFETAAQAALFGAEPRCTAFEVIALPAGRWLVRGAFAHLGWRSGLARLYADGTRDATFVPAIDMGAASLWIPLPDGGLLAATYVGNNAASARLDRLRADGSIDPRFAPAAVTLFRVEAMAAQSDGKVVIAGMRAPNARAILRLTETGAVDATFGGASDPPSVDGFVTAMRVLPDGAIALGGEFFELRHGKVRIERSHIARLTAAGTPDPAFEPR